MVFISHLSPLTHILCQVAYVARLCRPFRQRCDVFFFEKIGLYLIRRI